MNQVSTLDKVKALIEQSIVLNANDKVLIAISGGSDSVVMAHLLLQLGYQIGLAHCNFQLRGDEADKDETLVKSLASKWEVPFYHTSFNTAELANVKGISIQMAARDLRYDWLENTRKEEGYSTIATAHHMNDNAETLLLNLVKGTGIAGLHGILPRSNKIIRPILSLSKNEVLEYANTHKLHFRDDASNADNKYERNRIRLDVIPELETINPKLIETLNSNIQRFKDAETIYQLGLKQLSKKLIDRRREGIYISIKKLELLPYAKTFLYEILSDYGFDNEQVQQVEKSMYKQPGQQFYSTTHRVIRDREFLIISPTEEIEHHGPVFIQQEQSKVNGSNLTLSIRTKTRTKNLNISEQENIVQLDANQLEWPLQLRKWKRGDYFYPIGMKKKKKKVSDLLTDNKLNVLDKENTWVLLSGERICWVVGQRMDERYKITDATQQILEIKLK